MIDNLKGKNKISQVNFKMINDASEFSALSNNNFAEYYNMFLYIFLNKNISLEQQ